MCCMAELSELQNALLLKCLLLPDEKLHMVLMCVVPLMLPILRFTKHIRNCVMSSV